MNTNKDKDNNININNNNNNNNKIHRKGPLIIKENNYLIQYHQNNCTSRINSMKTVDNIRF